MELGTYQELAAYRRSDHGVYLVNEQGEEVLLPNKFVPEDLEKGDDINVFIYLDNEERLTATTQKPKIGLNRFAALRVEQTNKVGAFLDWGLDKQLLVPYSEQPYGMKVGGHYIVYLYVDDKTNRLVASNRYLRFLDNSELSVKEGEEVDLLICNSTEMGINVIINHRHKGLVYHNRIFQEIGFGDQVKGYIHQIREGNKVDVVLEKQGYRESIGPNAKRILDELGTNNGYLPFTDKSDSDDIRRNFGMSKKNFKKALGLLYKQRYVRLERDGVYTTGKGDAPK